MPLTNSEITLQRENDVDILIEEDLLNVAGVRYPVDGTIVEDSFDTLDKVFYLYMKQRQEMAKKKNIFFTLPYEEAAADLGIGTRTVQRKIQKLEDIGLISYERVHQNNQGRPCVYTVRDMYSMHQMSWVRVDRPTNSPEYPL
jgi:biotin operon repressor